MAHAGFVGDDTEVGGAVPRSKDAEGFAGSVFVFNGDDGSDGDGGCRGILEVCSAGDNQVVLHLGAAALEDALVLLGGLESGVLAEIALFLGDVDVAEVLRDFLGDEVVEFGFAFFEAGPGDDEVIGLLVVLMGTGDHALCVGVELDDAGHERALGEVFNRRGEQEFPHRVANDIAACSDEKVADEVAVVDEEVFEARGAFFGKEIGLEGAENGGEKLGVEEGRETLVALFTEPDEHLGGNRALADPFLHGGLELLLALVFFKQAADVRDQAGACVGKKSDGFVTPDFAECGFQGFEHAFFLRAGDGFQNLAELSGFASDDVGDGGSLGTGLEVGEFFEQVVAGDENLDGLRGIETAGA